MSKWATSAVGCYILPKQLPRPRCSCDPDPWCTVYVSFVNTTVKWTIMSFLLHWRFIGDVGYNLLSSLVIMHLMFWTQCNMTGSWVRVQTTNLWANNLATFKADSSQLEQPNLNYGRHLLWRRVCKKEKENDCSAGLHHCCSCPSD